MNIHYRESIPLWVLAYLLAIIGGSLLLGLFIGRVMCLLS